jgi:hypothetical protein
MTYRSLAKYCTTWARIWWEKCLEIAERSWVFSPQMIAPSGTIFSKATVEWSLRGSPRSPVCNRFISKVVAAATVGRGIRGRKILQRLKMMDDKS